MKITWHRFIVNVARQGGSCCGVLIMVVLLLSSDFKTWGFSSIMETLYSTFSDQKKLIKEVTPIVFE